MRYNAKSFGIILSICVFIFFCSCNQKDEAVIPLSQTLANNYWEEEIRFVYIEGGETKISENIFSDDSILPGAQPYGISLTQFYFDAQSGALWQYEFDAKEQRIIYYRNRYKVSFDDQLQTMCVASSDQKLMERNVFTGVDVKVISVTPNEIVFEVPIKGYVHGCWGLDNYDGNDPNFPKRDYLKHRIVWRAITDLDILEEFKAAKPID